MNRRERIIKVITHQQPDKVPSDIRSPQIAQTRMASITAILIMPTKWEEVLQNQ